MPDSTPVVLTPLREEDRATLLGWINDRESVILNSAFRPTHPAAHDAWFDSVQKRADLVIFAIRTSAEGKLVGTCQLLDIHSVHRSAQLQIRIGDPDSRGRGLGSAAVRALVEVGFRDLNLHRISLQVFADNARAQAVYRKLGFVEEGRQREAAWVDGRWADLIGMGLLRSDWNGAA